MKAQFLLKILISAFVLIIGAFALYELKKEEGEKKEEKEQSSFLYEFELKDLTQFQIKQKSQDINAKIKEGHFVLTSPVEDLANFQEISRWFKSLKSLKTERMEEKGDLKKYQFTDGTKVKLQFKDQIVDFTLSLKSTFDGRYFLKQGEDVFIGESGFHEEITKIEAKSFVRRALVFPNSSISEIRFQGKENFSIVKKESAWDFKRKQAFKFDEARALDLEMELNKMKAQEVISPKTQSSLSKYGLNSPSSILTLKYPDKSIKIKMSEKKDGVYLDISNRTYILKISKDEAKKITPSLREFKFIEQKKEEAKKEKKEEEKK